MTENQGLLVIYLIDSNYAFNQVKDHPYKSKFKEFIDQNDIDLSVPLIGYVMGFPPMENDPGGIYMQGDYELDVDEGEDEETENDEMPTDTNEN